MDIQVRQLVQQASNINLTKIPFISWWCTNHCANHGLYSHGYRRSCKLFCKNKQFANLPHAFQAIASQDRAWLSMKYCHTVSSIQNQDKINALALLRITIIGHGYRTLRQKTERQNFPKRWTVRRNFPKRWTVRQNIDGSEPNPKLKVNDKLIIS